MKKIAYSAVLSFLFLGFGFFSPVFGADLISQNDSSSLIEFSDVVVDTVKYQQSCGYTVISSGSVDKFRLFFNSPYGDLTPVFTALVYHDDTGYPLEADVGDSFEGIYDPPNGQDSSLGLYEFDVSTVNITAGNHFCIEMTYGVVSDSTDFETYTLGNSSNLPFLQVISGSVYGFDPPAEGDYGALGTRIISIDPYNGETIATSSSVTFSVTGFVADDDFDDGDFIKMQIVHDENRLCQGTGISFLQACGRSQPPFELTFENPVAGYFTYSATGSIAYAGNYSMTTEIIHPRWYWFNEVIVASSTYFVAVAPTVYDNAANFHGNSTTSPFVTGQATTTEAIKAICSPTTFAFNIGDCILGLFYPSPAHVAGWATSMRDLIGPKFPMGYAYDFYNIISTTTVGSLTVINATLPVGVIGAGSSINIDLTNSLDFILNATSSQFNNASGSSTETFFEITNGYWEIIVYTLLGFYFLRRILGQNVIPHFWEHDKEIK